MKFLLIIKTKTIESLVKQIKSKNFLIRLIVLIYIIWTLGRITIEVLILFEI
jgi:hypothetical protein